MKEMTSSCCRVLLVALMTASLSLLGQEADAKRPVERILADSAACTTVMPSCGYDTATPGSVDGITGATPRSGSGLSSLADRISITGYGTINYHNYLQYDTDEYMKDKLSFERFVMYMNLRLIDWLTLKTEFEYEYGGTGATMEFDSQEEAGEYEMEIEQGGEVKMEKCFLEMALDPRFNVRAGQLKLHIGLAQTLDHPTQYFTVKRPEMEDVMLPLGWYEPGVQLFGGFFNERLQYELTLSGGLDASGFSSRNWIKSGHQGRFEEMNAEALAVSGRVDWHFDSRRDNFFGLSAYWNNTTPNRPKRDLDGTPGNLFLMEGHASYNRGPLRFALSTVWGTLQNSDLISKRNKNLSNNLNVKRTPVGHQAFGASAEVGYDLLSLFAGQHSQRLYPFVRYDFYDTMWKTEGVIVKQPRWQRNVITAGLNWMITDYVVVKAEYQDRILGSEHIDRVTSIPQGRKQRERTLSMSVGFVF